MTICQSRMELPAGLLLLLGVLHVLGDLQHNRELAVETQSVLQAAWKEHKERFHALLEEMETKFDDLMEAGGIFYVEMHFVLRRK